MVVVYLTSGSSEANERVGRQLDVTKMEAIGEFVKGFILKFDVKEFFFDVGNLKLGGDVCSAEVGLGEHRLGIASTETVETY